MNSGKKLLLFCLVVAGVNFTAFALYQSWGHDLVRACYEQRAPLFLNSLIDAGHMYQVEFYIERADRLVSEILLVFPVFCMILLGVARFCNLIAWPYSPDKIDRHTAEIDALPDFGLGMRIALASAIGLFSQLLIIRIHSSYFQMFAYFKNVSLFSCFLGLGLGYALGKKTKLGTPFILPLLSLQIIFLSMLRFSVIGEFLQNPISEQLTFGAQQIHETFQYLFVYAFIIFVFTLNAICFIPLGQLASRMMSRRGELDAYAWNLGGSLAGIVLFSLLSFVWAPPSIWIIIAALSVAPFLGRDRSALALSTATVTLCLVWLAIPHSLTAVEVYSPYQSLTLSVSRDRPPLITTGNRYYQRIVDLSSNTVAINPKLKGWKDYYDLPYLVHDRPDCVLIVGAGAGNDAAAAVRAGCRRIEAVEIDPAILLFGRELHPEAPYLSDRVVTIVNDARAYIRQSEILYDLIVFGVLDSHILLSSKSGGLRLDSYVYTVESLRAARLLLKEGGLITLSFSLIRPELGRKLFLMLKEAFDGKEPVVLQTDFDGSCTFIAGERFDRGQIPALASIKDVTHEFANENLVAHPSTDDWPFFYMPVRKYPVSYMVLILILMLTSAAMIIRFLPPSMFGKNDRIFSAPCFFLGAGFMLIEAKGITELALVYGSTWIVTSIVIAAILIFALLANMMVERNLLFRPRLAYPFLLISVLAGYGYTFTSAPSLPFWLYSSLGTLMPCLPLFFAGFAFSQELKASSGVATALSSNLLGAMLGGFFEYNSMYFGFRSLYIAAFVFYALAWFTRWMQGRSTEQAQIS